MDGAPGICWKVRMELERREEPRKTEVFCSPTWWGFTRMGDTFSPRAESSGRPGGGGESPVGRRRIGLSPRGAGAGGDEATRGPESVARKL